MSESHFIFRLDPELKSLLFRVSAARGESPSDFARRAIKTELARLSYLSNEEKKALGLLKSTENRPSRAAAK
jgi:hypothetical protein